MIAKVKMTRVQDHFGFETIDASARQAKVNQVFDAVAVRYDLMNDLMSMGMHRIWKQHLINRIRPRSEIKFLDLAGGSGDIAFRYLEALNGDVPQELVKVVDINSEMLACGKKRALDKGHWNSLSWIEANAENLPLIENSIDVVACAFGMRNMTDLGKVLSEVNRVLIPCGKIFTLEFSSAIPAYSKAFYDFYSFQIIPRLGKYIAGNESAYRYLVESIRKFPSPKMFERLMRESGFINVRTELLGNGLVTLTSGVKT